MKKLAGNNFKTVDYFGIQLVVSICVKYLVTTKDGCVVTSQQKPELDINCGWLYDWQSFNEQVAVVDLEGMDWTDTLMEV